MKKLIIPFLSLLIISCNLSPSQRISGKYNGHYTWAGVDTSTCDVLITSVGDNIVNLSMERGDTALLTVSDIFVNEQSEGNFNLAYSDSIYTFSGNISGTFVLDFTHSSVSEFIEFDGTKIQ